MSTLKADTIQSTGGGAATLTKQSAAKTWVNFDGTASGAAARDSFNVSGMTDNGTGDYSVNFISAFNSANYVFQGASQLDQSGFANNSDWVNVSGSRDSSNPSATSHRVVVGRVTTEAGFDTLYNYMTYHGDLA